MKTLSRGRHIWSFALLASLLPGFSANAQEAAVVEPAKNEKKSDASEESSEKREKTPEFLRVLKDGKKPLALQTSVATYKKAGEEFSPEVALIGAVHIAEKSYYTKLNKIFQNYDALLYELVADPDAGLPDPEERGLSPVSTIQVGMKDALELAFQLDEIDYKSKNFVHADMTPSEFFECLERREEGLMQMMLRSIGSSIAMQSTGKGGSDIGILSALVANDRTRALRRSFADQMQMMDGQMAAITGDDGKSTLITERNVKAFEVLDREINSGKKKLAIFYGAGHLKDMHERLIKQGFELKKTEWLDAWDLR